MKSVLLLLFLAAGVISCTVRDPVATDYYNDLNHIVGGEKPTAPQIINFDYPNSQVLQWTASTDPDSNPPNQNVKLYFVYYYYKDLPEGEDLYSGDNVLFTVENSTSLSLSSLNFPTGTNYLAVSAFDGGRESSLSNIVSFVK